MTRRICVVTGSRAEYGLLRWVLQGINEDPSLTLQLVVTGMHLSPEFGLTYKEIEKDGFEITRKIEMLTSSDTVVGITKSMGLGLIGFADALSELQPHMLLALGDRYEIFVAVSAALVAQIPIAHIHGGETTEGAFDEALRHSITKMSQVHFVANDIYRRRVIQLGERPDRVFNVGGLGVDCISRLSLLSKAVLEKNLGLRFGKKNLLITFHPVTLDQDSADRQMLELLIVLAELKDTQLIFTMPNSDTGGRRISKLIEEFVARHTNARVYSSLGQLRYLSCISLVDGVIGNSSSGLLEVPSFQKPTVNIGDRQKGRLLAHSVVSCEPTRSSIAAAIAEIYSEGFQKKLSKTKSPYGEAGASEKILSLLKSDDFTYPVKKQFYDIKTD